MSRRTLFGVVMGFVGLLGFLEYLCSHQSVPRAMYNSLGLFFGNREDLGPPDQSDYSFDSMLVFVLAMVAPILALFGVITLVRDGWKRLILWLPRKRVVICGGGDRGCAVARAVNRSRARKGCRERKRRLKRPFVRPARPVIVDRDQSLEQRVVGLDAIFVAGDAREAGVRTLAGLRTGLRGWRRGLWPRRPTVVLVTGHDETNVEIAKELRQLGGAIDHVYVECRSPTSVESLRRNGQDPPVPGPPVPTPFVTGALLGEALQAGVKGGDRVVVVTDSGQRLADDIVLDLIRRPNRPASVCLIAEDATRRLEDLLTSAIAMQTTDCTIVAKDVALDSAGRPSRSSLVDVVGHEDPDRVLVALSEDEWTRRVESDLCADLGAAPRHAVTIWSLLTERPPSRTTRPSPGNESTDPNLHKTSVRQLLLDDAYCPTESESQDGSGDEILGRLAGWRGKMEKVSDLVRAVEELTKGDDSAPAASLGPGDGAVETSPEGGETSLEVLVGAACVTPPQDVRALEGLTAAVGEKEVPPAITGGGPVALSLRTPRAWLWAAKDANDLDDVTRFKIWSEFIHALQVTDGKKECEGNAADKCPTGRVLTEALEAVGRHDKSPTRCLLQLAQKVHAATAHSPPDDRPKAGPVLVVSCSTTLAEHSHTHELIATCLAERFKHEAANQVANKTTERYPSGAYTALAPAAACVVGPPELKKPPLDALLQGFHLISPTDVPVKDVVEAWTAALGAACETDPATKVTVDPRRVGLLGFTTPPTPGSHGGHAPGEADKDDEDRASLHVHVARALGASVTLIYGGDEGRGNSGAPGTAGRFMGGATGITALINDRMVVRAWLRRSADTRGDPGPLAPECSQTYKDGKLEQEEEAARFVHDDYQRREQSIKAEADPALRSWEHLAQGLKESNIAAVRGVRHHLEAVAVSSKQKSLSVDPATLRGLIEGMRGIQKGTDWDTQQLKHYELDNRDNGPCDGEKWDAHLNLLAYMEHGRWAAERIAAGWRVGMRNPALRTTSKITPWNALSREDHDRDRHTVLAALRGLLLRA